MAFVWRLTGERRKQKIRKDLRHSEACGRPGYGRTSGKDGRGHAFNIVVRMTTVLRGEREADRPAVVISNDVGQKPLRDALPVRRRRPIAGAIRDERDTVGERFPQ